MKRYIEIEAKWRYTTYLICFWAKEKEIKRNSSNHIYEEPSLKIMHGNLPRMADHFIVFINVCSPKVNENIDNEHNIHNEVNNGERVIVATASPKTVVGQVVPWVLIEEEGGHVRREDSRVNDEDKDEPVPHSLEGRVM